MLNHDRIQRCVTAGIVMLASLGSTAQARTVVRSTHAPTWTRITTAKSPPKRAAFAMAYDPVSKKVVVFGGYSAAGYLNDTWTFDGTSWVEQHPKTPPPGRAAPSMAFDERKKTLVLFGGYNGANDLSDTWLWDGATLQWTQAQPKKSPPAVTGPNLFTDPLDGHVDDFGGFDGFLYQDQTWRWNGRTWRLLKTPTAPTARSIAEVATNPRTHSTLLFGGLADVNSHNTWTWDGTQWTAQNPSVQPINVYGGTAAYDRTLDAVVTFGGGNGGIDQNDTWAWNGSAWTQLSPKAVPSPRESQGMAFDAAIGHIVLFGGTFYQKAILYNDTWEFTP